MSSRKDEAAGRGGKGKGDRGMDRLGDVLGGYLEQWGVADEVRGQEVLERWPDMVGEGIAEVTRARAVARGVLFVDVRSSAWMNELDLMKHDLLKRLNAGAGAARVEKIVFSLPAGGTWPPAP
jgi:predicted nucleic acid-binding Zn ribbon protein